MFYLYTLVYALTGEGGGSVTSALTTAFQTVASDALSAISAIVPIALPIMGAIIVVMVGVRLFKRLANK